jgi:hypothetical protein
MLKTLHNLMAALTINKPLLVGHQCLLKEYHMQDSIRQFLIELNSSPRFTIRNDKRIAIHHYHKPTGAQQHAVRELCKLGYSLY